jgi:ankyrin repeat protein
MNNERNQRSGGFWSCFALLIAIPLIALFQLSCSSNEDARYSDIFAAINNNDIKAVKDFIRKKPALVNITNEGGDTPLHKASIGRTEIAELLVAKGANVNARENNGITPLHIAAERGNREIVELLISRGADINARRKNGKTPLHQASENGYTQIAELLIAKGADVNAGSDEGTPLYFARTEEMKALLRTHGGRE